jgi:uncharacterized ferritin-like protein (DUF455 family)
MRSEMIHFAGGYAPFRPTTGRPDPARGLASPEGVADRLRLVAFAELQARDLFTYGLEHFSGKVPQLWLDSWAAFAKVEERHAQMLLDRMLELGVDPGAKTVSDKLSRLCRAAAEPVLFLFLLSSAEERGMDAGFILGEQMRAVDPLSADIFARIAAEEVEHVKMAREALAAFSQEELREGARRLSALL